MDASAAMRWSLAALAAAALVAFVWKLVPPLVNSDSAAVVLLASELVKSGRWLSPDWYYVSDSLMLDGSVHAAKIGVLLFGAGLGAARFAIAIGAILALLAGCWLGKVLSIPGSRALPAMFAFLLGPSLIYQDLMLGLPVTFQVALVLALLACAIRFALQKGAAWHLLLAASLIVLLAASTPKKALVYMLVPMIGGVASQWFPRGRGEPASGDRRRLWTLLAVSACAWGLGDWLHAWLKHGLVVNTSYARMAFAPQPAHILGNLDTIGALALQFAGGGSGGLAALAAVLAMACWAWLVAAPVAVRKPWQALRGAEGFAYGFAMAGTTAIFAYLLLYDEIRLYYGIYYGMVTVSPLFVLAAGSASGEGAAKARMLATRGALACLLLLGVATTLAACRQFPGDYSGIGKNQMSTSAERARAIGWLASHGFRRGFANYWDANAMTLVSGGRLEVSSLLTPSRRRSWRHAWLSTAERTNYMPGDEPWFIALGTRRRSVKLPKKCLPADRTVALASYRLYLYDRPRPGCLPPSVSPRRG
jgi:hypothetical protein